MTLKTNLRAHGADVCQSIWRVGLWATGNREFMI
jgi:hypothetical protein